MTEAEPSEASLTLASQLDELDAHLTALASESEPSQHFNADLFDRINYQLGPVEHPDLTARFLPRIGSILKQVAAEESSSSDWKGYPEPLVALTIKLLRPVPFTAALALCEAPYLATALASPQSDIVELALCILAKAAASPSDASILAANPDLLDALLTHWLLSPGVGVGEHGIVVLGDLLDVDCPLSQPPFTDEQRACLDVRLVPRRAPGHGAVWRRLFGDEGLAWATLRRVDTELLPRASTDPAVVTQRTIAQARLLRLLPRLAVLDFAALAKSSAPLGPGDSAVSLLDFATLAMVDRDGDELMHLTWIDYMMKLVGALRVADTARLSADAVRRLVREANDPSLMDALWSMPDNLVWTPEGEADDMRAWLREVAPRPAMRIENVERH